MVGAERSTLDWSVDGSANNNKNNNSLSNMKLMLVVVVIVSINEMGDLHASKWRRTSSHSLLQSGSDPDLDHGGPVVLLLQEVFLKR